jgi:hypothetical protein
MCTLSHFQSIYELLYVKILLFSLVINVLGYVNLLLGKARKTHGPAHNNRTMGLCNRLIGNSSANTLPRRCNDVTTTVGSCHATCVSCRQQPESQWTGWGSRHMTCVFCDICPICVYISEQNSEAGAVSWRSG